MVPSSVAKMKIEGAVAPLLVMLNPDPVPLNTCPVGLAGDICPGGTAIVIDVCPATVTGFPAPSWIDAIPEPLSDIQNGPVGLKETPQGLIRFGSVTGAGTKPSETKLVCVKVNCSSWS